MVYRAARKAVVKKGLLTFNVWSCFKIYFFKLNSKTLIFFGI